MSTKIYVNKDFHLYKYCQSQLNLTDIKYDQIYTQTNIIYKYGDNLLRLKLYKNIVSQLNLTYVKYGQNP